MQPNWQEIIQNLKFYINPQDIEIWFSGSSLISSSQERIIVEFDDNRKKEHVESHYLEKLARVVFEKTGRYTKIDLISKEINAKRGVSSGYSTQSLQTVFSNDSFSMHNNSLQRNSNLHNSMLSERFTFDNFIVGAHNKNAHAAALSVVKNPGTDNNPLFIYGGVGLGKTHLLQAIAHKLKQEKEYLNVLYVHSETFLNEIVDAIRKKETSHFKLKYRYVDVLLIDDIQEIQGKKATQAEFFHTFNTLYESNRHLIISSDRPPKNLTTLTDRIQNRFEWGLIAEISMPDTETKIKIISQKISEEKIQLSEEAILYIANHIKNDIRAIVGAVKNIKFNLNQLDISQQKNLGLDLIKEWIRNYIQTENKKNYSPNDIVKIISNFFQVPEKNIISKDRSAHLVFFRDVITYFLFHQLKLTKREIGHILGGRDHSSIISSIKRSEEKIKSDEEMQKTIASIAALIS